MKEKNVGRKRGKVPNEIKLFIWNKSLKHGSYYHNINVIALTVARRPLKLGGK